MDIAAVPELDHQVEAVETEPYCCDHPKLAWNGDPDAPGVACVNCGYVIAEQGNTVIWREKPGELAESQIPKADTTERQGSLF